MVSIIIYEIFNCKIYADDNECLEEIKKETTKLKQDASVTEDHLLEMKTKFKSTIELKVAALERENSVLQNKTKVI